MRRGGRRSTETPRRVVHAHIPHPNVDGASLCGDVTEPLGCPVCVSKLIALLLIHVQSARKPDKSFCGLVLMGDGVLPMGTAGADPSPAYVSIERAREVIEARREDAVGAVPSPRARRRTSRWTPPICPGCESNLERFDDAHRRRSDRSNGQRPTLETSDVVAEHADDEE